MVLCALSISQAKKDFCHYDLHSSNILMCDCDKDLVMVHILNKNNSICIPTNGYIPKIIDFGFCKSLGSDKGRTTTANANSATNANNSPMLIVLPPQTQRCILQSQSTQAAHL